MLTKSALTIKSTRYQPEMSPGVYGFDQFDLTGHIGPLWPEITADAQWPMYSFDRPSHILWNAIGKRLCEAGWTDDQIKTWLQSKAPRWALNAGGLGDQIQAIGKAYAETLIEGPRP